MKTPILPMSVKFQPVNEWQLCPKCDGCGNTEDPLRTKDSAPKKCDLCLWKMIISKITGKPPEEEYRGPTGILSVDDNLSPEKRMTIIEQWRNFFWGTKDSAQ